MTRVFLNYRTGDGEQIAALAQNELSHRFGSQFAFRAGTSIPAGDDFQSAILRAVRSSDAMVAIIGPRWLEVRADGTRAIDNPADWPRREIVEAMGHDVLVIPLLVANTPRLEPSQVPSELRPLTGRQYVRLDPRDPAPGLVRLATRLSDAIPGLDDLTARPAQPAPQVVTNNTFGAPVEANRAHFGSAVTTR